jgi:hypothetical protein
LDFFQNSKFLKFSEENLEYFLIKVLSIWIEARYVTEILYEHALLACYVET